MAFMDVCQKSWNCKIVSSDSWFSKHYHEAGDIVISSNWEALLEGLGLMNEEGVVVSSNGCNEAYRR